MAAKEDGKYAIGVDVDQSHWAPGNVAAYVLLDHGFATYDSVKQAYDGNFTPDQVYYGLNEGMSVIAIPDYMPEELKALIAEIEQLIIEGVIDIPKTTDTR